MVNCSSLEIYGDELVNLKANWSLGKVIKKNMWQTKVLVYYMCLSHSPTY